MRRHWQRLGLLLSLSMSMALPLRAQDTDGPLSQAEVEKLRDVAPLPVERIKVFVSILNDREKDIADLVAKPHRVSYAEDMHDAMEQFGQILNEFNDNLDEYEKNHRDVRKELPKVVKDTDRWGTVLRSAPEDDGYSIVKKIALDNLKDTRDIVVEMEGTLDAYFKAHPEALKEEKARQSRK